MAQPLKGNCTFSYNGATITVRPSTGMDVIRVRALYRKFVPDIADPDYEIYQIVGSTFAHLVQRSTVEGNLGFAWPEPSADPVTLRKAAMCLLELDGDLFLTWEKALNTADEPLNDPDQLPPDQLPEEKKETPPSSENEPSSEPASKP
jgi:hypothetical protein